MEHDCTRRNFLSVCGIAAAAILPPRTAVFQPKNSRFESFSHEEVALLPTISLFQGRGTLCKSTLSISAGNFMLIEDGGPVANLGHSLDLNVAGFWSLLQGPTRSDGTREQFRGEQIDLHNQHVRWLIAEVRGLSSKAHFGREFLVEHEGRWCTLFAATAHRIKQLTLLTRAKRAIVEPRFWQHRQHSWWSPTVVRGFTLVKERQAHAIATTPISASNRRPRGDRRTARDRGRAVAT